MPGYTMLLNRWNTQWGPAPVPGLLETASGDRTAPITLPDVGLGARARASANAPRGVN